MKEQLAELKMHFTETIQLRDAARKDSDVANRIDVSQREIKLLEEAPPEAENAIVSP